MSDLRYWMVRAAALLGILLVTGCASTPTVNPPLPQLVQGSGCDGASAQGWCGKTSTQVVSELRVMNNRASARMRPGEDCKDHALYAWDEARTRGYTSTQYIYTCPYGVDQICHQALLVDTGANGKFVLDNGTLLSADIYPQSVGYARDFMMRADGPTVVADNAWEATEKLRALTTASAR